MIKLVFLGRLADLAGGGEIDIALAGPTPLEDLLLGLVNGIVPYHQKRRATPIQWARFVLVEVAALGSTRRRVRRSKALAAAMVAEGPKIPELRP